jgi:hypothetical protein
MSEQEKPKPPQARVEPPLERREVSEEDYKKFANNWAAFMKKSYEAFKKSSAA